jgi:L-rhamnose mutarotase
MKLHSLSLIAAGVIFPAIAFLNRSRANRVQRIGMVIGIRPDQMSAYEALHAASNEGVRDLLAKYHMHNFSIYIEKLEDGRYYLFGYYEYTGRSYKADMEKLAAEPRNQEWLAATDPMQIPLPGKASWSVMREVYHNP